MIVSCGDSFFYGSDLRDRQKTWPALIADSLGHEYHCRAQPGVGNLQILQQIIQARNEFGSSAIYLVNWTWVNRFDYVSLEDERWHTVRPSLDDAERDPLYYRYFHSEMADKFTSLVYTAQALDVLKDCRSIMTYMDHLILDQQWHAPDYIRYLQEKVRPYLRTFQGQTFLEWSRSRKYPESERWHPLEEAHVNAATWWLPTIKQL